MFTVLESGLLMVQDLGRSGMAGQGVAPNGAGDRQAFMTANTIVGNAPDAVAIEGVASGALLVAERPLLVAVTGAVEHVTVDALPRRPGEPFAWYPGEMLSITVAPRGMRWYLGVNGDLSAQRCLGSVAPDVFLGVGRTLSPGALVEGVSLFGGLDHPFSRIPLFRFGVSGFLAREAVVDVTPGPDATDFPDLDVLFAAAYRVSPASDHVGLRITGRVPAREHGREILSRGVPVGAIELPPGGEVIALLRGRFVTAGYPVPAVATERGVDVLAQLAPGAVLRFRAVTTTAAVAAAREARARLAQLQRRVLTAFAASGISEVLGDRGDVDTA